MGARLCWVRGHIWGSPSLLGEGAPQSQRGPRSGWAISPRHDGIKASIRVPQSAVSPFSIPRAA